MAKPVLFDTDVLVDFFRGQNHAIAIVNAHASRFIVSPIVIAELYAGVRGDAEEAALARFFSLFRIIPVSAEIAKLGGLYKRDFGKSHGISLADAIIAATCETENAELKTLNIRHYPMMDNLSPAYNK